MAIVVDVQEYKELFYLTGDYATETLSNFRVNEEERKNSIDRRTLMSCSSLAEEYFTFEPDAIELHLPVCYPRKHASGVPWEDVVNDPAKLIEEKKYFPGKDNKMAYIRMEELRTYIVPWLKLMERVVDNPV